MFFSCIHLMLLWCNFKHTDIAALTRRFVCNVALMQLFSIIFTFFIMFFMSHFNAALMQILICSAHIQKHHNFTCFANQTINTIFSLIMTVPQVPFHRWSGEGIPWPVRQQLHRIGAGAPACVICGQSGHGLHYCPRLNTQEGQQMWGIRGIKSNLGN